MKKELIFVTFIFALTLISFTSAKLSFSEIHDVYSLGDRVFITVNGITGSQTGNLNIDLFCKNNSVKILKIPAIAFDNSEQQSYSLPYKELTKKDLEIDNLKKIIGECQFVATLGSEEATTKKFTISDGITINAELNKKSYNPGEPITLQIEAIKANGLPLNGFVEASNATTFIKTITEGKTQETFSLNPETESGNYKLNLFFYDKIGEEILNKQNYTVNFKINQIPQLIETSLSKLELPPTEELKIGAKIYDQSGKEMSGKLSLTIVSPTDEQSQKTLEAGEFAKVNFDKNASAGTWKIFSDFEGVEDQKEFTILPYQEAEFKLQNNILHVKNIGNTRYNKSIELKIGEQLEKLSLNIKKGEERKFSLKAPEGKYKISVSDGKSEITKSVPLTGKSISVKDVTEASLIPSYSLLWVFLILILAATGTFFFLKYKNKTKKIRNLPELAASKFSKKHSSNVKNSLQMTNKSPDSQSLDDKNYKKGESNITDLTKQKTPQAESSLVVDGQKHPSAITAINIKNFHELKQETQKRVLDEIKSTIKDKKGLIDIREDFIFVVFSPLITKTFKNEVRAIHTGIELDKQFKKDNKKFAEKISYGIGINSGDLVASKVGEKLKYTSIGNTVSLAQKISTSIKEKVLISESVNHKMMRNIKSKKVGSIGKNNIYEIQELKNIEENKTKLKDLLKRMER